jgi:hypothetical protein
MKKILQTRPDRRSIRPVSSWLLLAVAGALWAIMTLVAAPPIARAQPYPSPTVQNLTILGTCTGCPGGGGGSPPAGAVNSTQYNLNGTLFGGVDPGVAGRVLTSNGSGAPPTFQASAGSVSIGLAPGFASQVGTYNTGNQVLTSGGTLSGQDKIQPQTINYTIVYPDDTGTTEIAAGVSGPIIFTLRNPGSATAFTTSPTFQDGTGFGFTLTTTGGTATFSGPQPGAGGTSITFPPGSVVTCTDTATTYVCSTITPAWNVIAPTGTPADDVVTQAALNGPAPVYSMPGQWYNCTQLTVPNNQVWHGAYINPNEGSNAGNILHYKTVYHCPTGGSFTTGQAHISTGDRVDIDGIGVLGNSSEAVGVDCFQALNTAYPTFHVAAQGCTGWGVNNFSDGSVPGPSQSFSQGLTMSFSYLAGNAYGAYYCNGDNGGFCSDMQIGPQNEIEVNGCSTPFADAPGCTNVVIAGSDGWAFQDNRCEDGGVCAYVENSGGFLFSGTNCDKNLCLISNGNNHFTLTGNRANDPLFSAFDPAPIVSFTGSNIDVQASGNVWTANVGDHCSYSVTSPGTVSGYFAEAQVSFAQDPVFGSTVFCDAYSASQIAPLLGGTNLDRVAYITEALSGSAFIAPNFDLGKNFQFVLQNSCTSGSPCLIPNPVNAPLPLNQHGYYQIINSPSGSAFFQADTLYAPYTVPTISAQPVSITTIPYVVQQNGIAFQAPITVQNSAGAGNSLTGGAGMTSGWSTSHATLANAVGGCTDPKSGSACSTLTEDATANVHQAFQSISQLGAATYSAFVNAGTPNVSFSGSATFSSSGNGMTVTAVGSGTVGRGRIQCSCAANGIFVVGLNSGTGGTGTYFTSRGVNVSSPAAITINDWRYLAITIDDGGSNSAAIGIDPNNGDQVDALSGHVSSAGNSTGAGVYYGGYVIPEAGGWYFVSMTYTLGTHTATEARLELGLLGQANLPDWLDYPGTGGGFLQLWNPQLIPLSPAPTGITTIPGALSAINGVATFEATSALTKTLTISTSTFTPILTSGVNQQMTLVHASCPCTVANPTGIASVPGQEGMIDVIQSSAGSDTVSWGSQYIAPGGTASLTLSTGANDIDHIPYRVIDGTHILLGSVLLNATH